MARVTHEQKVLALLSDGRPHSHMEGYRLGVMLHSRVAGLRKKGYGIVCDKTGGQYVYTLVSRPLEAETASRTVLASSAEASRPVFDLHSESMGMQPSAYTTRRNGAGETTSSVSAGTTDDSQLSLLVAA